MAVAVVTGAGSGIGLDFARKLLARGTVAHMIVAARSPARCAETLAALAQGGTTPPSAACKVEALECDLGSLASVASFCREVKARVSRVDLLVLNAGMLSGPALATTQVESSEGLELTFATNHLAHFAIALALHPLLEAAGAAALPTPLPHGKGARVVLTSSAAHGQAGVPRGGKDAAAWETVARTVGRSNCMGAYSDTKLANLLHAREVHKRYAARSSITAHSLHPGVIRETGIWAPQAGWSKFLIEAVMFPVSRLVGMVQTVSDGGDALLACADVPVGAEGGASLYRDVTKWVSPSRAGQDAGSAAALWQASEALLAEKGWKA